MIVAAHGCTGLIALPEDGTPPGVPTPVNPPVQVPPVDPPPSSLRLAEGSVVSSYSGFFSVEVGCAVGEGLEITAPGVQTLAGESPAGNACPGGSYQVALYLPPGSSQATVRFAQGAASLDVQVDRRPLPSTALAQLHEQVQASCLGCHMARGGASDWGSLPGPEALLDFVYANQAENASEGRARFPALASTAPPRDLRLDPGAFLRRIVHHLGGAPSPIFAGVHADAGSMPPVGTGERAALEGGFTLFDLAYAVLSELPADSRPPPVDPCLGQVEPVEPRPVERLTNEELHRTVQVVFALPDAFASTASNPLPAVNAAVTTYVEGLGFPALPPGAQDSIFEDLLAYSEEVAAAFDVESYNRRYSSPAGCSLQSSSGGACLRRHVETLLSGAFRGEEVPSDAVDFVVSVYDDLRSELGTVEAFVHATSKYILLNPFFLFKSYRGESTGTGGLHPLTSLELATRLSFLFWGTGPDPWMLGRDWGRLLRGQSAQDAAELERALLDIVADGRANHFLRSFGFQWLNLKAGIDSVLDDDLRPSREALQRSIDGEFLEFLRHAIIERRPLDELLTANHTYLDRTLAELYGLDPSQFGDTLVRVDFADHPELQNRRGLLTQAKVLSEGSMPSRPSAAHRGVRILRHVVCSPMGPPSGFIIDQTSGGDTNLETITEAERFRTFTEASSSNCANCHLRINPVGFPFHAFDRLGRHDLALARSGSLPEPAVYENVVVRGTATSNPSPIWKASLFYLDDRGGSLEALPTADGTLSGSFDDHLGLIELLATTRAFERCVVEHLYDYALGLPSTNDFGRDAETIEAHACVKAAVALDAPDLLAVLAQMVSRRAFTTVRRN